MYSAAALVLPRPPCARPHPRLPTVPPTPYYFDIEVLELY